MVSVQEILNEGEFLCSITPYIGDGELSSFLYHQKVMFLLNFSGKDIFCFENTNIFSKTIDVLKLSEGLNITCQRGRLIFEHQTLGKMVFIRNRIRAFELSIEKKLKTEKLRKTYPVHFPRKSLNITNKIVDEGTYVNAIKSYIGHGTLGVYWFEGEYILVLFYTWREIIALPVTDLEPFLKLKAEMQNVDDIQVVIKPSTIDFIHQEYGKLSFAKSALGKLRHAIKKFK